MENILNQTLSNLTNEQIAELRHNSGIPTDSWKAVDATILESAQRILNAGNDLISRGLTAPLDIGTKVSIIDVASRTTAEFAMEIEHGAYDRSIFKSQSFAIPVVKQRAQLGARDIASAANAGVDLPQQQIREAVDACMDAIEGMVFDGVPSIVAGTNKVLGLKTTTAKNEITISDWSSSTNATIPDFEKMYAKMYEQGYTNGGYMLYVSPTAYPKLTSDYKTQSSLTFVDRIRSYPGMIDVRPSAKLSGKSNVLVNMNPETIDLAVARDVTAVPIQTDIVTGTQIFVYGVMGIRIKSDFDGKAGVVVGK